MRLLDAILEVVAPTRCAGCDFPGTLLCDDCRASLAIINQVHACPRCGAPFGLLTCTECWQSEFAFEAAWCLGTLERPLSRCITLYKDGGERRLAPTLAGVLLDGCDGQEPAAWVGDWADAIVAVPASRAAVSRRGFDHAASLAQAMADRCGVPRLEALARPVRRDQRALGRAGRQENLSGAFTNTPDVVVPKRVLLIDDVMTTGSTLDAAAEALLASGAQEVRVWALARAW